MLAGHWPYWRPDKIHAHPDELLRARLTYADSTKSLVEQDLVTLADGLEGRSTNPVSLLVSKCQMSPFDVYDEVRYDANAIFFLHSNEQLDSLQNPCADLGMDVPSMLCYKYHPDKEVSHLSLQAFDICVITETPATKINAPLEMK